MFKKTVTFSKRSPCCVAVGCSMRSNTNSLSSIKMFRFPKDEVRRKQWETAVHREHWKATNSSFICNRHFISGEPSQDPNHPDYVPTKFLHKKDEGDSCKLQRFKRASKRQKVQAQDSLDEPMISSLVPSSSSAALSPPSSLLSASLSSVAYKDASTMTELTKADIEELEKVKKNSDNQFNVYRNFVAKRSTFDSVFTSETRVKFYTKLPTSVFFYHLLALITESWDPEITNIRPCEQLLMVLMKLRLGLLNQDIGYRFLINASTVGKIVKDWLFRMNQVFSKFIIWPSSRLAAKHLPACFKHEIFKNTICILDCSEIFIDVPFNLDARAQTYSHYKHNNTVKFLLGISPSGSIIFISTLYGGRHSDKSITIQSGILEKLKFGDAVLADRGFLIGDLVGMKGARLVVPSYTRGKLQLSAREVSRSRLISKARVHVERSIRRIKSYRILKNQWPPSFIEIDSSNGTSMGNNILTTLCGLCNVAKGHLI